jgi:plasmid stabilization system protein ParE
VIRRRLAVIFGQRAARQIQEAADWWQTHREGSPAALTEDLVRALDLIFRQPGVGKPIMNERLSGVRRLLLPRVGYFLFYRVAPRKQVVQVLAFWHASRGSRPKL